MPHDPPRIDGADAARMLYGQPGDDPEPPERMDAEDARTLFNQSTTEDDVHRACIRWATAQAGAVPELRTLFHIPNGGARDAKTGARLKRLGTKPGVPDLCLPVVRDVQTGDGTRTAGALWIELKSPTGRLRDSQRTWRDRLRAHGHAWTLCRSLNDFAGAVTAYLDGRLHAPTDAADGP